MRILTVRQPWASLIVRGVKDIENRSFQVQYRGPLLIHAAAGSPRDTDVLPRDEIARLPRGVIVGIVTLVDIVTTHESPWFEGPYGWRLTDALTFRTPIPHRGQLALVRPPQELLERVEAELVRCEWVGRQNPGRVQRGLWS